MSSQTEIYSIFGQIEKVAADMMIERGKASKMTVSPREHKYNDEGKPALMYITIPRKWVHEFETLIENLRA